MARCQPRSAPSGGSLIHCGSKWPLRMKNSRSAPSFEFRPRVASSCSRSSGRRRPPAGGSQIRRKPRQVGARRRRRGPCRAGISGAAGPESAGSSRSPCGRSRQVLVAARRGPVEPADLVVLAVGVVVAALRARELVAAQDHRRAGGEQQIAGVVLHHLPAQREHRGIVGVAFGAAIPRVVVVGAVADCSRRWPRCACRCRRPDRAA